ALAGRDSKRSDMSDQLIPQPESTAQDMGAWVKVRHRVAFGHCDPAGIAYTGRIIDYALEAIEEFWKVVLSGRGWFQLNVDHGIGTPFVNIQIDFQAPITPRSFVETEVRVVRKGETSITFEVRGAQLEKQVFSGVLTCVFINKDSMSSIKPPDWISTPLQRFLPPGQTA
ncbi:MAG: acyl-CoA thioesterase, partial [Aestuariivirga sp.]